MDFTKRWGPMNSAEAYDLRTEIEASYPVFSIRVDGMETIVDHEIVQRYQLQLWLADELLKIITNRYDWQRCLTFAGILSHPVQEVQK